MGREDIDIIIPAISKLMEKGIAVSGPYSADTLFHDSARKTYDAAMCMYHDQALIPIKTLDFDTAVNVTLGLPFIRTSPDHGTALDIAGAKIRRTSSRFCLGVEHGDYNGTNLFGVGTDRYIWVAYKANNTNQIRLASGNFPDDGLIAFASGAQPAPPGGAARASSTHCRPWAAIPPPPP